MNKEHQDMTSMSTGKYLLIVQHVLFLHHFLHYSIPQNLGVASKVTTLEMDSTFSFADFLLHLQAVFRVARKNATVDIGQYYTNSSSLGMIYTNGLINPTEWVTDRAIVKFSSLPTYDIWSLGCIIYHRLFGSPLCNFYFQQINS